MREHGEDDLVGVLLLPVGMLAATKKEPGPATVVKPKELSLVRVNVTGQPYDYVRPWQKRAPFSKRALGAVLPIVNRNLCCCRQHFPAALAQRFVCLSAHPQAMQQDRELSRGRNHGSFLPILSTTLS